MTSPRQRKKWAAFLAKQSVAETVETKVEVVVPVVVKQLEQEVAAPAQPVVVSEPVTAAKPKKTAKNGLVEIKEKVEASVDQVVEQTKPEVKTETKE